MTVKQPNTPILKDKNLVELFKAVAKSNKEAKRNFCLFEMIQDLICVADAGSLSEAAGEKADSGLSTSIKRLEQIFRLPLRSPATKKISLTAEGKLVVKFSRRYLSYLGRFYQHCVQESQNLTIAAGDSLLHIIVIPRFAKITALEKSPSTFYIKEFRTAEVLDALREFRIDFGLVREKACPKHFNREFVGTYSYRLFVPAKLLNDRELSEEIISTLPLAMIRKHWDQDFVAQARASGITIVPRVWCDNFSHVARLVRFGTHAAIMPGFFMEVFDKEEFPSFRPAFLKREPPKIVLAWHPRNNLKLDLAPLGKEIANILRFEAHP